MAYGRSVIGVAQLFPPILYSSLQIIGLTALGFFLTRYGRWAYGFFRTLSSFIVKVALPLYFFTKMSRTDLEVIQSGYLFPLAAVVIFLVGWGTGAALISAFGYTGKIRRAYIALSSFGNGGIIPMMMVALMPEALPIAAERFGTAAPPVFVAAYLLVYSPLLWSLGNYFIAGKETRLRWRDFITPPMVGILSGFLVVITGAQGVLLDPRWPLSHLFQAAERLGEAAFPLILVSLGSMMATLKGRHSRNRALLKGSVGVMLVRYLILPSLFYGAYFLVFRRLSLTPAQLWVLFLVTHVPPATNLAIMVARSGIDAAEPNPVETEILPFTMVVAHIAWLVLLPFFFLLFLSLPGVL